MAKGLALVSGASSGIGFELAELFAGDGYDLVVAADEDSIESCADKLRGAGVDVRAVQVDLRKPEDVDRLYNIAIEDGRTLQAAALNAGSGRAGPFIDGDMDDDLGIIDLNVRSTVQLAKLAEARIKLADMRAGRMSDDDWTRMARRMGEITEAPLYIDDSPNLTMMEIRAKARRLKQKTDLRLVVVDYLQLMTSGKRVESRQAEVAEFSRSLKLLAKELEVPVIAVSQLNRGPEQRTDKLPQLSDLRETGQLEQDADLVILINRPDGYDRDSPRAGEADLILAKHRNGPTKTITVAHQLHLSRFANMAKQ